jgi:hypothetical protein
MHLSVISSTIPRTHSFWSSLQIPVADTRIHNRAFELQQSRGSKRWSSWWNPMSSGMGGTLAAGSKTIDTDTDTDASAVPLKLVPSNTGETRTRIYVQRPSSLQTGGGQSSTNLREDTTMGGREDEDTSQSSLRGRNLAQAAWSQNEITVEVDIRVSGHDRERSRDS